MMTIGMAPFNKLVKLVARAFYDTITFLMGNDNRGILVVVVDALTGYNFILYIFKFVF